MTLWQRIKSILAALMLVLLGLRLIAENLFDYTSLADIPGMDPEFAAEIRATDFSTVGYSTVLLILSIILLAYGIRMILFYFTMARHMNGGRYMLYRGILFTDLALLTFSLQDVPVIYIMTYLIGLLGFSGAVDIFRAFDARKIQARWKGKLIRGVITLAFAIYAFLNLNTPQYCVFIYSASLFYNALMRLASAFRRTELITIQ
jgi:uncharacterized membrane protein HdeD (DUF308 family)